MRKKINFEEEIRKLYREEADNFHMPDEKDITAIYNSQASKHTVKKHIKRFRYGNLIASVMVVILLIASVPFLYLPGNHSNSTQTDESTVSGNNVERPIQLYSSLNELDMIISSADSRRYVPLEYPKISITDKLDLPIYKANFLDNSTHHLRNVARQLGIEITNIAIDNDNALTTSGYLKYSQADLKLGKSEADNLVVYNNGTISVSLMFGLQKELWELDMRGKDNSQVVLELHKFIETYNKVFAFDKYHIEIQENNNGECIVVEVVEKNDNLTDSNKILNWNNVYQKKLKIKLLSDHFSMIYTTNDYYEYVETRQCSSVVDVKEKVSKNNGIFSSYLTKRFTIMFDEDLIADGDSFANDGMIMYSYDIDGYYRPVYIFEREASKSGVSLNDGTVKYDHYYVFYDPLKIAEN